MASVATFGVFVVLATSWVMTQSPTLKWAMFVPLVGAVLILPRELPLGADAEEVLVRTKLWLSMVRFGYFLVALFVMLGLPAILRN